MIVIVVIIVVVHIHGNCKVKPLFNKAGYTTTQVTCAGGQGQYLSYQSIGAGALRPKTETSRKIDKGSD